VYLVVITFFPTKISFNMTLQIPIVTIQRRALNCIIPVISILCINCTLAIGTNTENQREKLCTTDEAEIMKMIADTMDYSLFTQKELKQEPKKLEKTDRER